MVRRSCPLHHYLFRKHEEFLTLHMIQHFMNVKSIFCDKHKLSIRAFSGFVIHYYVDLLIPNCYYCTSVVSV